MDTQPTPSDERVPGKVSFTLSIQELEEYFDHLYTALDELVDILWTSEAVARYCEQQFNALADVSRRMLQLMDGVASGTVIPPEWLAQRDILVAQVHQLIDENGPSTEQSKEEPQGAAQAEQGTGP